MTDIPSPEALKLTPALKEMLRRIERNSGSLLLISITASGGRETAKLNKLRAAGYVVKCDHPTVKDHAWPAEAVTITPEGKVALENAERPMEAPPT